MALPWMRHTPQEVARIIELDLQRHYKGRGFEFDKAYADHMRFSEATGRVFHAPNVLIVYSPLSETEVEFHTMNAGTPLELVAAVKEFLSLCARGFQTAVTFYDNPKVSALMGHSDYPITVDQINEGTDRTYRATFTLGEQHGRS